MTASIPPQRSEWRQTLSGSRRAWKLGSTGTSSPNPSGTASNASSSTCLTGFSSAFPRLTSRMASRTFSSRKSDNRSKIFGFLLRNVRSAVLSTICRSSQSSLTAVSISLPHSGARGRSPLGESKRLRPYGSAVGSANCSPRCALLPSHGRAPRQVPRGLSSIAEASCSPRDLPHSHRMTRSARSPLVPRSSSQSGRRHHLQPDARNGASQYRRCVP